MDDVDVFLTDDEIELVAKGYLTAHGPATEAQIGAVIKAVGSLACSAAIWSLLKKGRVVISDIENGEPVFVAANQDSELP